MSQQVKTRFSNGECWRTRKSTWTSSILILQLQKMTKSKGSMKARKKSPTSSKTLKPISWRLNTSSRKWKRLSGTAMMRMRSCLRSNLSRQWRKQASATIWTTWAQKLSRDAPTSSSPPLSPSHWRLRTMVLSRRSLLWSARIRSGIMSRGGKSTDHSRLARIRLSKPRKTTCWTKR